MKRNILLFVAAAFTLLLSVSCNRECGYEYQRYATLYQTSYSVSETVGELRIPVIVNNAGGSDSQVSIKVDAGKAVEGVDFEVVTPANGILNFTSGVDTLEVVVNITSFEGEFTGAKDFRISIASATEGVTVSPFNVASVVIQDLDHPLAPFIGTWTGTMPAMFQSPTYDATFVVTTPEDDDTFTKLVIDAGINPYFILNGINGATYNAVVEENTAVVAQDQSCAYSDVVLRGFNNADPDAADAYDDLYFELQDDGSLKLLNAFGPYTAAGGGFYEIYLGGAVFTKK